MSQLDLPTAEKANLITHRSITHVGYVVDDLAEAVDRWTKSIGAGPFVVIEHIEFDSIVYDEDGPVVFDHSAAFGQCGEIAVELMQMHTLEPAAGLGSRLGTPSNRCNHVAYYTEDLTQESLRLEALGAARFLHVTNGPVNIAYHDAPWLGHPIEVHQDSDFIRGFFADLAEMARGWDGADPMRILPLADTSAP